MKKNFTVILVLLLSLSLFGFKTESNSPKVLRDEKVEADVEIDETAPEISPKLDELKREIKKLNIRSNIRSAVNLIY